MQHSRATTPAALARTPTLELTIMARREGDFDEQGAAAGSAGTGGSRTPTSGDAARSESASREEDVRQRAYDIYLARGASDGGDVDDWLAAEREMRAQASREPERSEPERSESARAGAGTWGASAGGERGVADQTPSHQAPSHQAPSQRSAGAAEPARGGRARRTRPGGGERAD